MPKFTAHEHIAARKSIEPAAHAIGVVDGASFNSKDYEELLVVLDCGTFAATATADVKIQVSVDDVTFTDLAGAVFAQIVEGVDDDKMFVGRVNLSEIPEGEGPYVRARATVANAAADLACSFMLLQAKELPATQEQTVGFSI